ncbi:MAG: DUF2793 domain-containing protein [Bradyrhizobiaceae bacterium]|nr:MAG: DUF2793 domain-containing protein [Bradyrhizobiaceae bacterium]
MTDTANLALPFIDGSQAQKHVTHNEALRILDAAIQIGVLDMTMTAPPSTPADGERHVVASGATGAWSGQAMAVAVWEDGAWRFLAPKAGWLVWSAADNGLFVFDGSAWSGVTTGGGGTPTFDNVPHIGVNSTAADPNLLSVHSNAALFNSIDTADGGTGDARIQISKESSADTASVVFSDSFSGRAEFGLVGSDDFKLKVSGDGTTFVEAFTIDQSSGNLTLPRGLALSGVISPAQITANQNDYNPAGIASASVLQISSDASRTISGLAGGGEGRILCILNVGSQTITLADESASSSASNRFTLGPNLAIASKQAVILRYDGTALRWFALARPSSGGGLSISTSADLASAISDETGSGALVFASSPALSGTPLAPTAAVDTSTTQIATTAFVLGQASVSGDGMPAADGTAARGTSTHYARADHVHPTDTSRAPASNIALSALATQANNTFVGNVSGSTASPSALSATQVTGALAAMVGDTGSGGTKGLVPAPGAGDAAAGKFLKADGTYAVPPGTGGGGSGSNYVNRIINPFGAIWQRNNNGAAAIGDAAYAFDQWYALRQTSNLTASRVSTPENGTPSMMRLSQPSGTAQRFGIAQAIESANIIDARGQSVTLSARVRMSAATTLRYAILEWTGTADSPTKDVVNNWTSTTYTAGNFFISTSTTLVAAGSTALSANTLTSISLSGTVSSSMNNLIVLFWTDSAQAQNVTFDIGKAQLELAAGATSLSARSTQEEIILCQRYFSVSPSYSGGWGANTTNATFTAGFPVAMRAVPIMALVDGSVNGGSALELSVAQRAVSAISASVLNQYGGRFDVTTSAASGTQRPAILEAGTVSFSAEF